MIAVTVPGSACSQPLCMHSLFAVFVSIECRSLHVWPADRCFRQGRSGSPMPEPPRTALRLCLRLRSDACCLRFAYSLSLVLGCLGHERDAPLPADWRLLQALRWYCFFPCPLHCRLVCVGLFCARPIVVCVLPFSVWRAHACRCPLAPAGCLAPESNQGIVSMLAVIDLFGLPFLCAQPTIWSRCRPNVTTSRPRSMPATCACAVLACVSALTCTFLADCPAWPLVPASWRHCRCRALLAVHRTAAVLCWCFHPINCRQARDIDSLHDHVLPHAGGRPSCRPSRPV